MVTIDKIKLAQTKVDETKSVMRQNVNTMSENVKLLDEEIVPTAIELAARSYNMQEQAVEVLKEEQKRTNRLFCFLAIIVVIIVGVIALFFLLPLI